MLNSLPAALLCMVATITLLVYLLPAPVAKPQKKRDPVPVKPAALFINDEMYRQFTKLPEIKIDLDYVNDKIMGIYLTDPFIGIPVYRSHILNNIY